MMSGEAIGGRAISKQSAHDAEQVADSSNPRRTISADSTDERSESQTDAQSGDQPEAHDAPEAGGGPTSDPPDAENASKAERGAAATPPAPLNPAERRSLNVVRHFGTVAALLMAVGALGAGAAPVINPVSGVRFLGLLSRMPTVALAITYTGMLMLVASWLWLGRLARPGRERLLSRSQMDRTLVMWTLPFVVAPPMFSRDVYSYLAQSEIAARGMDPYELGPATALGVDDPLTRGVTNIWRETPAPYQPLFLFLSRGITAIASDNVVAGILLHRLLALLGFALIVWALPRLARRCGVQPVYALWLGAANPLLLFHLVSGIHNEALMIGLMMAGLEIALSRSIWIGAILISLAAMIKIPAVLALGFLGAIVARRNGGRIPDLLRIATGFTLVFVFVTVGVSMGSTLGFGWIEALSVPGSVRSWLSPVTAVSQASAGVGILLGVGDHTDAVISLARVLSYSLAATICARLLWAAFRGRIEPLVGLGAGLGAVVLLGPVLHPWYLLWAAIPLAASSTRLRFRLTATAYSAIVALLVFPTGSGFDSRTYVVAQALLAALAIFLPAMFMMRKRIPAAEPLLHPAAPPH
ncbi:alpha-1,6-mannosyltransferase [Actinoalloteichus hymeniacidonis]|nr:alpha-1,6-mannosyltransferase [Actinoalloteichus hymeniacidonis]